MKTIAMVVAALGVLTAVATGCASDPAPQDSQGSSAAAETASSCASRVLARCIAHPADGCNEADPDPPTADDIRTCCQEIADQQCAGESASNDSRGGGNGDSNEE